MLGHISCIVLEDLHLRARPARPEPPPVLPAFDSVTISAVISDTLFTLRECSEYLEWIARLEQGWDTTISPPTRVPKLRVMVHNRSSLELQFPDSNLSVSHKCSAAGHDVEVRLGPVSGTGAQIESSCEEDFVMEYSTPGCCALVGAGDSLLLEFPVVNPLYASAVTKIWPGMYWVVLGYHSWAKEKEEPPVWRGQVRSDTVFFRVAE